MCVKKSTSVSMRIGPPSSASRSSIRVSLVSRRRCAMRGCGSPFDRLRVT